MSNDTDERLVELESRLAFQDQTIHELNEVVTRLQSEVVALTAKVETLREALDRSTPSDPSRIEDERPPHY